ncbi:MAG: hypothetical protein RIQ89_936 [Bacteroidota bacterium]|jgi:cell surface protein SprA
MITATVLEAAPLVLDSDSTALPFPFDDRHADPYNEPPPSSPLALPDPANIKTEVEYDLDNHQYNISERMGDLFYRNPSYMTFEEFKESQFKKSTRAYFKQRSEEDDKLNKKSLIPGIKINSVIFDRIFGGTNVDIRPQGSAELIFALNTNKNGNPSIPVRQRKITTFDFDEQIQMNVTANIGEKMKLSTNNNTQSTFDFENRMKLEYTGYEDDIIKKIEAGNVSFPSTRLIDGSQTLFGVKTQLQFGRLTVTNVFSQQRGNSNCITVNGGAQTTFFEIRADQYEVNKHFFLGQYFKDQYDNALKDLNLINSGVNITRIEVWVTNTQNATTDNRNVLALTDLGEYNFDTSQSLVTQRFGREPDNKSNDLLLNGVIDTLSSSTFRDPGTAALSQFGNVYNFSDQKNYALVTLARKLQPSEYTVNNRLGYISLNVSLNPNQVLAVAYEYTLNGRVYKVGELSTEGIAPPRALFVKLLRSRNIITKFYTWDLMMKNIYSLNGFNIAEKDFRLDVMYQDDKVGSNVNFISEGCSTVNSVQLVRLFNMDDMNVNQDPQPDGLFDYIPGITIQPQNGKIIFPVREPFGSYLRTRFCGDSTLAEKYAYDALYDSTVVAARQIPEKNKFLIKGSYQSGAGSDIPLNAVNLPQGSVKVNAGGRQLSEGADYTVDYTLGRVKILNTGVMSSNSPIQICFESQSLFALQTKTMFGSRFEYFVHKDLQLGGTVLRLSERPLTQKVNIGDEPISNTMIGVDGNYRTESRFITKLLDKLPLYNTKEPSSITLSGEFARLIPGNARAISRNGISYIDDFEGAVTPLDIRNPGGWYMSSIPHDQPDLFPEGNTVDSLIAGYNRGRINWYFVDPLFQRDIPSLTPSNIDQVDFCNNYTREVRQKEIFPNRAEPQGPQVINCTNIAFYPDERGPYNFDPANGSSISAGINASGKLNNPKSRWGGVMRRLETNDFQASNIEFLEFWMMDPFANGSPNSGNGGEMYINLGTISEDILPDNKRSFENGLPTPNNPTVTFNSNWGRYTDPNTPSIVNAFDNDEQTRSLQDVGLDGLDNTNESQYFANYISNIIGAYGSTSAAAVNAATDPSADDYKYFQSNTYNNNDVGVLDRYKYFNNMEGNSPAPPDRDGYPNTISTVVPDVEDVNKDNNTETTEAYFQYKIDLRPSKMVIGQNYITDIVEAPAPTSCNTNGVTRWYQFKIPVTNPEKTVGFIENYNRIDFIRLFMRDFDSPVICRFARMQLLRSEWRRYVTSLLNPAEFSPTPEVPGNTSFDILNVSLEENGKRAPVNYLLPPGIERQIDPTQTQVARLNEQSLSLRVCNLEDGDARAAFKTLNYDLRNYKKLKMFLHAEPIEGQLSISNGDLTCFLRIGTDFTSNYYEYEIPLQVTAISSVSAVSDPYLVWPTGNEVDLDLQKLVNAKLLRNNAISQGLLNSFALPYTVYDGDRKITIKGNPNVANVRAVMIGVRNPSNAGGGPPLCGEIWVNELRMTDFEQSGGYKAIASINAKLADLGTMNVSGEHSSAQWGNVAQKINERQRFASSSYDMSTQVELGKFIPEKANVTVPFYFSYGETFVKPQFNPLDPDVKLKDALNSVSNKENRDSIRTRTEDYTQRKSLNFTNVKKNKKQGGGAPGKSKIYDIENFNLSYTYNELYQRNIVTEYSIAKQHTGIVAYNFFNSAKPFQPFQKSKALNGKYLKLIKDFNIGYAPTNISIRGTVNRNYSETQLRNNIGAGFITVPTYIKLYRMTRDYDVKWDLTKSLKVDFNAQAQANIDEPFGRIDSEQARDSVLTNIRRLGRLMNYHHTTNVTYNLPLNKIPILDWITINTRYSGDYSWQAAPLALDSASGRTIPNRFANTIQNSQNTSINGNFNLQTLYNKVPYFKKLSQPKPAKKEEPKSRPKNSPTDSLGVKPLAKDTLKKSEPFLEPVFKTLANLVTSVKTISLTYSETNGTMLPGFLPTPEFGGVNLNADQGFAPGFGFVLGSQNTQQLRNDIIRYNWLTPDSQLNTTFNFTRLQNFTARANIEPFKNFKIELSANRNFSLNHQEFFRFDGVDQYRTFSPTESGNFSMSYLTWSTAFVKDDKDYSNETFRKFDAFRKEYSQLLAAQNINYDDSITADGYSKGYGANQAEVLNYAFLSAYSGKPVSLNMTTRFPKTPRPNWRVTYDGLSKIKSFQKIFQSFNLSHGYRSSYNVNSFFQNLSYIESQNGDAAARDINANFIPKYDIQMVTITEQLAPLIGVDMTLKNSMMVRVEYKRDRTLSLSFANIQITEIKGQDYTVGLGYRFKKVALPFVKIGNKKLVNDLNVRGDFNLRQNNTIIRKLIEGTNQPSAGTTNIGIKFSADYNINDRFNIKAFYDRQANEPFVSSSFPNSNTRIGFSIRFSLAQ